MTDAGSIAASPGDPGTRRGNRTGNTSSGTRAATVGVDVGGTKLFGVAMAGDGTIVAEARHPVAAVRADQITDTTAGILQAVGPEAGAGPQAPEADGDPLGGVESSSVDRYGPVAAGVVALVRHLVVGAEAAGYQIEAVGVGLPGLVDRTGRLTVAPNLPQGNGLDLGALLPDLVGVPVAVDNDATCAALGEWRFGAARDVDDAVIVTLGTGIGAGIVAAGQIVHGARGFAGEFGHMVVEPGGLACPCGRSGCWERYASGDALGRVARRDAAAAAPGMDRIVELAGGDPGQVHGEHVTAAAAAGDGGAQRLMAEVARWVAIGFANIGVILDPELVVVGGGLVDAGDALFEPLRRWLADPGIAGRYPIPNVVAAELGSRAGAVGAAALGTGALGAGVLGAGAASRPAASGGTTAR